MILYALLQNQFHRRLLLKMLVLACFIFLVHLQSHAQAQILRTSCKRQATFKLVKRNSLLDTTPLTSTTANSITQCALPCLRLILCKSINYNSNRELCQLLPQTQQSLGGNDLKDSLGWNHYEPVIRPSSRFGCLAEPCGVFQKCLDDCTVLTQYKCQDLQNIALHKPALDAPPYPYAYIPPSRAVDGNTNPVWYGGSCSHTTCCSVMPWWRVDFQGTARVYSMKITNRQDCCSERLSNFNIRIGDSSHGRGELNTACYSNVGVGAGETKTFVCKPPLDGRYLYIQSNLNMDLTICEVQAFGEIL